MNDKEQLEKIKRKMVSTLIYLTRLPEKYASEVIDQILAIPEIKQALGLLEKKDNLCASCDTPLMNEVEMEDKEPPTKWEDVPLAKETKPRYLPVIPLAEVLKENDCALVSKQEDDGYESIKH